MAKFKRKAAKEEAASDEKFEIGVGVGHPGSSRQRSHQGGSFKTEAQRRYLWAVAPTIAKQVAHNESTKGDPAWATVRRTPPVTVPRQARKLLGAPLMRRTPGS